ncbi:hypothetical protein MES5069_270226 [Mesorhizobium escarrei]|uniref:Recombinase domain-containing protein n=1 Tax=Mesorhizobium escarrei TaxID=666018 RepID=A0ABN8JTP7_9HYPH|nr:hypothetical protein MES5069_270226 [Mesorhizobium escarrei]
MEWQLLGQNQISAITRFAPQSALGALERSSIQQSGITSLRGLAIALNNRGVRTVRNGQWQVSNVRNILARQSAAQL